MALDRYRGRLNTSSVVTVEVEGGLNVEHVFSGVAERMANPTPAFEAVLPILEQGERAHFARLNGRYVDSGDTKRSLTEPTAKKAIREIHGEELIFGTSIFYARFLRKKGKVNRNRKSAVLVLTPATKKAAEGVMMAHIRGGGSFTTLDTKLKKKRTRGRRA